MLIADRGEAQQTRRKGLYSTVTIYHRATTGGARRPTLGRLAPVRLVPVGRTLVTRFRSVPVFVLYPQLFLGIGWLRAALAHGLEPSWWNGEEVAVFARSQMDEALPFYRPFLEHVVVALPGLVAVVVVATQILVGVALLLNHHPWAFALGGGFLNLHFILAGRVNPSVFYIVMAMTVVLWTVVDEVPAPRRRDLAVGTTVAAVMIALLCLPFARTLDPAAVIGDPALVVVLLATVLAASTWTAAGFGDDIEPGTTVVGPASAAEVWPDRAVDQKSVGPGWYSVRCHFRFDETAYEERITVWQAADFDDAVTLAEAEAYRYAKSIRGEYLESCDCHRLASGPASAPQGFEMYSLVRTSELDPETYLRTLFFTGSERSSTL